MSRLSAALLCACLFHTAAAQDLTVQVNAGARLRPMNRLLYGINTARWDESLFPGPSSDMLTASDRDALAKIKASGITLLKYPGGNDADAYIWDSPANNTTEMDTDEYLALCRETGAEPFITVNFNEPPALAAEWVRYCNQVRGADVKLWEVGDEQWGWWTRGHASPEEYAKKYIGFAKAMKAVDPTITVATNVSLGPHPENWTERVLKAAGSYIDMLTVTFFPQRWGEENDDTLFASVATYREQFTRLRADVERIVGKPRADSMLFVNVGYNSVNHSPGPQTLSIVNALWTADMLGAMAASGTDIACYWALHNYFPPRKGDYGYLSSDGNNTPRAAYFVFPLFAQHFADTLVEAVSSDPAVGVYSARDSKRLSVLFVNKHLDASCRATTALKGFTPRATAKTWTLNSPAKGIVSGEIALRGSSLTVELPPASLLMLECVAADSVIPPVNLASEATAVASSTSETGPHFLPPSAIDGNLSTRWNSAAWTKTNGEESQWLALSWPTPQRFSQVRIRWGESWGTKYTLECSDDGKQWRQLASVSDGKGGVEEWNFVPVSARYLRMNGTRGTGGRSTVSAYSIREIEVYELPSR
jgi:hypothetical protein